MVSLGPILRTVDGSHHRSETRRGGAFALKGRIPTHPDWNGLVPLSISTRSFEERAHAEESRLDLVGLLPIAWITGVRDS